jgi:uncharacterized protein
MIGRKEQLLQIEELMNSGKSEFVAVLGRRRVGKTYLIDNAFEGSFCFKVSGLQEGSMNEQLRNFDRKLNLFGKSKSKIETPKDWGEAFDRLQKYCDKLSKKKKHVLFFDELPWMCTAKSNCLTYLAHFWNDYLSKNKNFILVICGSASSWIEKNITNNRMGMHNRLTEIIMLKPFTLQETKLFLESKRIKYTNSEISRLYMSLGGIPYYLDGIKRGETVTGAIDRLCFQEGGRLKNEYDNLYRALFKNYTAHESIIQTLAGAQKGLMRKEIIDKSKLEDGGAFTRAMSELIACGFVSTYNQFAKKKRDEVYRLADEYSSFYHKYIKKNSKTTSWNTIASSQSYKIWLGFSFEFLVFRHVGQVLNKLGISGLDNRISTLYIHDGKKLNTQIDLIIERSDNVVHLCEIKYYDTTISIDKYMYSNLKNKVDQLRNLAGVKKSIYITMICSNVIKKNEYALELVDSTVHLEDLFQ